MGARRGRWRSSRRSLRGRWCAGRRYASPGENRLKQVHAGQWGSSAEAGGGKSCQRKAGAGEAGCVAVEREPGAEHGVCGVLSSAIDQGLCAAFGEDRGRVAGVNPHGVVAVGGNEIQCGSKLAKLFGGCAAVKRFRGMEVGHHAIYAQPRRGREAVKERRQRVETHALPRHTGVNFEMDGDGHGGAGCSCGAARTDSGLKPVDVGRIPHDGGEAMRDGSCGFLLPYAAHDQNARARSCGAQGDAFLDAGNAHPHASLLCAQCAGAGEDAVSIGIGLDDGEQVRGSGEAAQQAIIFKKPLAGYLRPYRSSGHRAYCGGSFWEPAGGGGCVDCLPW